MKHARTCSPALTSYMCDEINAGVQQCYQYKSKAKYPVEKMRMIFKFRACSVFMNKYTVGNLLAK